MNIYLISLTVTVHDQINQVLVASASEDGARKLVSDDTSFDYDPCFWGVKKNWTTNIEIELLGQLDKNSPYQEGDLIREFWAA